MQVPNDLLQNNRRMLERRLRDLGLLSGVNDAERMKKLKPRYGRTEQAVDVDGRRGVIGPRHATLLAEALSVLLGDPMDGTVAFVRCLPSEQIDALIASDAFAISNWTVDAVIDSVGDRRITADQAVEQREDKSGASFLLIDPLRAGAGLDGIYSAGREIGEAELFGKALDLARKPFWGRMSIPRRGVASRRAPWPPPAPDAVGAVRLHRDRSYRERRTGSREAGALAN